MQITKNEFAELIPNNTVGNALCYLFRLMTPGKQHRCIFEKKQTNRISCKQHYPFPGMSLKRGTEN